MDIQTPKPKNWFLRHEFLYAVLGVLLLVVIVGSVYWWKEIKKDNTVCIQVVTSARNLKTGEIKIFGNPCQVPKGWVQTEDVVIYFKEKTKESEILAFVELLKKQPWADSVDYLSPAAALQEFIARHKNEPGWLESVNELPGAIPAHITVHLNDIKQKIAATDFIKSDPIYSQISQVNSARPSTSSGQSAEMGDWKTYTNSQYGFSFQYPATQVPTEERMDTQYQYTRIQNYDPNTDSNSLKPNEYFLELMIFDPKLKHTTHGSCPQDLHDYKIANLGLVNGYIGKSNIEGGDGGGYALELCAQKDGVYYDISVVENSQTTPIANQIFSTFKFTEPETWNIYKDDFNSYEIKYPSSLTAFHTQSCADGATISYAHDMDELIHLDKNKLDNSKLYIEVGTEEYKTTKAVTEWFNSYAVNILTYYSDMNTKIQGQIVSKSSLEVNGNPALQVIIRFKDDSRKIDASRIWTFVKYKTRVYQLEGYSVENSALSVYNQIIKTFKPLPNAEDRPCGF